MVVVFFYNKSYFDRENVQDRKGEIVQRNDENIILFPKWREDLQEESLLALKEKRYTDALPKLNQLLAYNINSHEIMIGKLICLMELGQYDEAQSLCEELLVHRDEKYYQYMHIYLTLLFQTNQFEVLLEQIDIELADNNIPSVIAEQFQQLYQMSHQMKSDLVSEQTTEYIEELTDAIQNHNHVRQLQLIENLRKMKVEPIERIITYLEDESVHPVTKTAIFKWLQDNGVSDQIHISKLNLDLTVHPIEVKGIRQHTITKQVMFLINRLEQKNPTLYILLEQLFYRYVYVRFPIMPQSNDVEKIAKALRVIGNEYLHIQMNEQIHPEIENYIKEIKMCERLYL